MQLAVKNEGAIMGVMPKRASCVDILTILGIAAVLAWPAFYNGYPLVFSDSAQYMHFSLSPRSASVGQVGYPVFYSIFILPFVHFQSLYFIVAAQALLSSVALRIWTGLFFDRPIRAFVVIGTMLASLTQLPWLVSWIMTDVFAGLGFLALMGLAFGAPRAWRAMFLLALLTASMLVSTGSLLVLGALISAMILFGMKQEGRLRGPLLACLFCAAALPILANLAIYRSVSPNVGSSAIAFARWVEGGIAQDFLRVDCNTASYKICAHLDELDGLRGVSQGFLWQSDLAKRTDAWRDPDGEYARLNRRILFNRPLSVLSTVAAGAVSLLASTSLGADTRDDNWKAYPPESSTARFMAHMGETERFQASRQQRAALDRDTLNAFGSLTTVCSILLALLAFAVALLRRDVFISKILFLASVFLVGNAVVHGGLVGPFVRYHVKVVWVLIPLLAVAVPRLWHSRPQS